MLADLAKSGLDAKDAERLGLQYNAEYKPAKDASAVRAYAIPYFDLAGKYTQFFRIRLLDPWTPKGEKKPRRYTQPPGMSPEFYLPPYFDWRKVAKDPTIDIVFTEGEKKAAALCKLGVPCIGLGGVWNFLSRENNNELV